MVAGKGFWAFGPFLKKGLTPEARMLDHYTTGLHSGQKLPLGNFQPISGVSCRLQTEHPCSGWNIMRFMFL
jgi:hypothetical protein